MADLLTSLPIEELRAAALGAAVLILVDAARAYGFISGGPDIDVDRCEEALAAARDRGIAFSDAEIDAAIPRLLAELEVQPGPVDPERNWTAAS